MHLAGKIHKELKAHFSPDNIVGTVMTCRQVSLTLNKILRPMGAQLRIIKDRQLTAKNGSTREYYSFSGYYNSGRNKNPIMINLHITPTKKLFKFTPKRYTTFVFMFSQVVQHEFIHQCQNQFRPEQFDRKIKTHYSNRIAKKRLKEIDYLSAWSEIEAYAHDIAMEIHHYYSNENPVKILKNIDQQKYLYSFICYKDAFKGVDWSKLKKSLLRKVWKWLPSAHIPKFQ